MDSEAWQAVPVPAAILLEPVFLDSLHVDVQGLDGDGVRLWLIETDRVSDEDHSMGRAWLDEAERDRASLFVRRDLARDYEIAHAAARRLAGAVTQTRPDEVAWGRHPCPGCGRAHGRLRVVGEAVEISLSHTSGWVLIALADEPVGVDVEAHPADPNSLVGLMHPREIAEIEAAGVEAAEYFARAWVRKEAYLKGLGIGLAREPHLDHLGADPAALRRIGGWHIRDVHVAPGYAAAVAYLAGDCREM